MENASLGCRPLSMAGLLCLNYSLGSIAAVGAMRFMPAPRMLAVAMSLCMLLPMYHALWGRRRALFDRAAAVVTLGFAAAVWYALS